MPIEKAAYHYHKMIQVASVVGMYKATFTDAQTYVESAERLPDAVHSAEAFPYMAYANLIIRISDAGISYLHNITPEILNGCEHLSRGHLDYFVNSLWENKEKLQHALA